MGMLSPVQHVHFVTRVLKSISPRELFTVRHQKGITYLRILISNPSVRPFEIWNLITLNKWGGGQHKSFYFHLTLTESVLNWTGAGKVGSRRVKDLSWHLQGQAEGKNSFSFVRPANNRKNKLREFWKTHESNDPQFYLQRPSLVLDSCKA